MSTSSKATKSRVLFVDDEPRLLESIAALLRRDYEIEIATSGDEALRKSAELKDLAVVVSDFRMPKMDGATFLHEMVQRAPLASRILLTGEAGVEGARDAVNKGRIFRFLMKPCPTDQLKEAIDAGIALHRLAIAERRVLKETLIECISALMEVLAVTNPVAFGRAQRIKKLVADAATRLDFGDFWQLEAAALLSQIGYFAAAPELAEKIYYGRELTEAEKARAAAVPANAQRLFEHVPRLEPVLQILAAVEWNEAAVARLGEGMIGQGARILKAALDFDSMKTRGVKAAEILQQLRSRKSAYGEKVVDAFAAALGAAAPPTPEVTMPLREAKPGMRLRDEIRTQNGALLVPIGFEVSERLIQRISQIAPEALEVPVRLEPVPQNS